MKHRNLMLVILLILLSVALTLSFSGITITRNSIDLNSNEPYQIRNYNFLGNTRIDGSITVSSQSNRTISFWVTEPNGKVIVQPFKANETGKFAFVTDSSGLYTFYFDNDYDLQTMKTVTLTFDTQFGLGIYTNITNWIALALITIMLLIVVFSSYRKKAVT